MESKAVDRERILLTEPLKVQLSELYFQSESIRLDDHIPEHFMHIGEKQLLKEVIANVKNASAMSDELSTELLGVIRVVPESTDISLAKRGQGTNKDNELSSIRQAVIDQQFDHIPQHYRVEQKDLSAELGLVFCKNKMIMPN